MKLLKAKFEFKGLNELELHCLPQGEEVEWLEWMGEKLPTNNEWIQVRRLTSKGQMNNNEMVGFVPSAYVQEVDSNYRASVIFRSSKSVSSSLEWDDDEDDGVGYSAQSVDKAVVTNDTKPAAVTQPKELSKFTEDFRNVQLKKSVNPPIAASQNEEQNGRVLVPVKTSSMTFEDFLKSNEPIASRRGQDVPGISTRIAPSVSEKRAESPSSKGSPSPKRPSKRLSWFRKEPSDSSLIPATSPLKVSPSNDLNEWFDLYRGKLLTDPMPKERCIILAQIISCHRRPADRKFWYTIQVHLQGRQAPDNFLIYRLYDHFFELQTELLQAFPHESGTVGNKPRIIPYLPGPKMYISEKLAESRLEDLDRYVTLLLDSDGSRGMPRAISQCLLVQSFFVPSPHDILQHPYNGMSMDGKIKYWTGIDYGPVRSRSEATTAQCQGIMNRSHATIPSPSSPSKSRPLPPPPVMDTIESESPEDPPIRAKRLPVPANLIRLKVYHSANTATPKVCTVTQVPRCWPLSMVLAHLHGKHPKLAKTDLKPISFKELNESGNRRVNLPPRSEGSFDSDLSWIWCNFVMSKSEGNLLVLE